MKRGENFRNILKGTKNYGIKKKKKKKKKKISGDSSLIAVLKANANADDGGDVIARKFNVRFFF